MNKKSLVSLLALVSILGLTSCNKENSNTSSSSPSSSSNLVISSTSSSSSSNTSPSSSSSSSTTPVVEVENITVTTDTLSLEVGESVSFGYEVLPNNATDKSVSFSYDDKIISLDEQTLNVVGLKEGKTTIVITSTNGKSASIAVEVKEATTEVAPTAISTDFARTVIGENETLKVDVTFYPAETTLKNLKFRSSDPSCIKVDSANQTITGVAATYKSITITISSTDNTLVNPIRLSLKVTSDENEVKNDKATASLNSARKNEQYAVKSGSIKVSTKYTTTEPVTFRNDYDVYDDHIYNEITTFTGETYKEYHGMDSSRYYEVKYDKEGKVTNSSYNNLVEEGGTTFTSDIVYSDALYQSTLPAFYAHTYSSKYTYGITEYLDSAFFDTIYANYKVDVEVGDDYVYFNYTTSNYTTKTYYRLTINFDGDNYKSVIYDNSTYNYDDLDENYQPVNDQVQAVSFNRFEANVNNAARLEDTREDKVDPAKFYFKDFTLSFYKSTDTERKNPLTTFDRGDTIVYVVESSNPSQANLFIDPIYAMTSSNEEVLSVSENHFALNAVGEGEAEIYFRSIFAELKVTLKVNIPAANDIVVSTLPSSMKNTDSQSIFISADPYGALEDFDVTLKEGDEKYARLVQRTSSYYVLYGMEDMDVKEKDVTIIIQSRSNPELRKEITIKIMKALSAKEIQQILIDGDYVGAINEDYYNYTVRCQFTSDYVEGKGYAGVYTIYKPNSRVFSKFDFYYTIANGKLTIVSTEPSTSYVNKFVIEIYTPDCLTLYSSFNDLTDDDGEYTVTYRLTKEVL